MDVMVYDKHFDPNQAQAESRCWHSNHRVFADLQPGDRLWVITSGKRVGRDDGNAGYLLAVWPVAQVIPNPGDDPNYPAPKYQHRILVNEAEANSSSIPFGASPGTRSSTATSPARRPKPRRSTGNLAANMPKRTYRRNWPRRCSCTRSAAANNGEPRCRSCGRRF